MSDYTSYLLKKCQKVSKMKVTKLENKIQQLQEENKLLRECVEFYDGVHRLNWCVDLNKLEKYAHETLAKIKGDE